MITIYHNPRCRKSREALNLLEEKGTQYQIVEYLKEPLSETALTGLLQKLEMKPEALIRKNEVVWKEKFKGKALSDQELIRAMVEYPKLIERPIVVRGKKAVVARPADRLSALL